MKKATTLFMVVVLLITMFVVPLSGCGTADKSSKKKVFVIASTNMSYDIYERGTYPLADAYVDKYEEIEKEFNCEIQFKTYNVSTMATETHQAILAGEQPFDICEVGFPYFYSVLAAGDLYAQNTISSLDLTSENFNPPLVSAGTWNGNVYGSNYRNSDSMPGLFYNREMLESKGLEDPYALYKANKWTFSKLKEYLLAFTGTSATGAKSYGILMDNAFMLMNANGGGLAIKQPDGKVVFGLDNPKSMEAVQFLRDLRKAKAIHPQENWDMMRKPFCEGEAAFMLYNFWAVLTDIAPSGLDFGFVPLPRADDGEQMPFVVKEGPVFVMPKNLKDPEFTGAVYNKLAEIGPFTRQNDIDYFRTLGFHEDVIECYQEMAANFVMDPSGAAETEAAELAFLDCYRDMSKEPASEFAKVKSKTQAALDDFYNNFKQ